MTAGASGHVARRRVVAAAAAALPLAAVSGCEGIRVLASPPPPADGVAQLQAAITAEKLMVARYTAALRQSGSWPAAAAAALRALHTEHTEHLTRLSSFLVRPSGSPPSPAASGRHPAPDVPAQPADAMALLTSAEQAAAADLAKRLTRAPAALAQLFASIAASEATHVPVLSQAAAAAR